MIEPSDTADPPPSRPLVALLVLTALLRVVSFAAFVPGNDWTRDLVAAFAIADGAGMTARGAPRGPWPALGFAALMLLPGWDLLHSVQLTHAVLLETLMLASWLALWRDGDARHWSAF